MWLMTRMKGEWKREEWMWMMTRGGEWKREGFEEENETDVEGVEEKEEGRKEEKRQRKITVIWGGKFCFSLFPFLPFPSLSHPFFHSSTLTSICSVPPASAPSRGSP